MKKKFKSKKNIKLNTYLIITSYIIIMLLIIITLNYISKQKIININPVEILKYSNNYTQKSVGEQIKKITNKIIGIDINKPTTILNTINIYKTNIDEQSNSDNKLFLVKNDIIKTSQNNEPLVYIYNTHPTEQYQKINEPYNIDPNVVAISYYLEEKLEKMGINTIVEESNVSEILQKNNWNYNQSYIASRIGLEKVKEQYPSIRIFIDLHRDALDKDLSTTIINEKSYAKILFLVGIDHNNYNENLEFAKSINNMIINKYPTITRGVMESGGYGVNGIYNQDVAPNIILLELGGNNNTIDEAVNTIDLIAPIIKEKINEK